MALKKIKILKSELTKEQKTIYNKAFKMFKITEPKFKRSKEFNKLKTLSFKESKSSVFKDGNLEWRYLYCLCNRVKESLRNYYIKHDGRVIIKIRFDSDGTIYCEPLRIIDECVHECFNKLHPYKLDNP